MANTVDLQFSVTKQDITRLDDNIVASGAIHTVMANFDFCATWDGIHKYARFEGAGGIIDVRIEDDKCTVPWEVIEAPSFTVAVFGTKTTDVMITTRKLAVKVYQSANFIEPEPIPSTPSLAEKFEQYILDALAAQEKNNAEQAANNEDQDANNDAVAKLMEDATAAVDEAIEKSETAQTKNNNDQAQNNANQSANDAKIVKFEQDIAEIMAALGTGELVISNETIDSLWAGTTEEEGE